MSTIVDRLRDEAKATEELNSGDSQIEVMREAATLIEALLNRDHRHLVLLAEFVTVGNTIMDELNARIDAAPGSAKPVFRGVADLQCVIAKATAR